MVKKTLQETKKWRDALFQLRSRVEWFETEAEKQKTEQRKMWVSGASVVQESAKIVRASSCTTMESTEGVRTMFRERVGSGCLTVFEAGMKMAARWETGIDLRLLGCVAVRAAVKRRGSGRDCLLAWWTRSRRPLGTWLSGVSSNQLWAVGGWPFSCLGRMLSRSRSRTTPPSYEPMWNHRKTRFTENVQWCQRGVCVLGN